MAATGYTPIYIYYSGTSTHVPLAANLGNGELAINAADGNLFYKNTSNAVVTVPLLQSSGSQNGWLSSTDWTTFNGKQAALGYTPVNKAGDTMSGSLTAPSFIPSSSTVPTNGMYLPSANVVSIATNSQVGLTINDTGSAATRGSITIGSGGSYAAGVLYSDANWGMIIRAKQASPAAAIFRFADSADAELMRIAPSGGVSIGNTTDPGATNLSVTGTISNSGETVNGTLWMKDASQIQIGYNAYRASIYNNGAGPLILTPTSGYGITLNSSAVANGDFSPYNCYPQSDNAYSCGTAGKRWSVVYAATGSINTSDESVKEQVTSDLSPELKAWAKVEYCKFKYSDAIERKGDGARWHIGLIAQKVKEAFDSEGLDAFEYGLLCYDEWEDEYEIQIDEEGNEISKTLVTKAGNIYGIRYEEALAMECAYLRSMLNK